MDNLLEANETDTNPSNARELYSVIRKRSQGNLHVYGITTYMLDDHHKKIEVKRRITKGVYELLLRSADPNRNQIKQRRYCFVWEKQSFNLDEYIYPFPGLFILRVNSNGDTEPKIPPFLKVGQECTDSQNLSSYQLSLKGATNPLIGFS
jgi:CYTH domain-containing protein